MRSIVILGSALISTAAAAETPAPAVPNPNERICVVRSETGTRLGRVRTCATRAQWAERRRNARAETDAGQLHHNSARDIDPAEGATSLSRYYVMPQSPVPSPR